ncbi:hypothetical protein Avbf_12655 [Armadillidium vulgare]|nr:hypothetical protein Avbf_12655 [Armadillidium vulgare]
MSTNIGVNTEMLITAVKDRPCLWNKFHGDYKDRNKSSQAWKEGKKSLNGGTIYQTSGEGKTIRKKWFKDEEICLY